MLRNLIRNIEKGKVDPLYLFHGAESFLIEEMCRRIKDQVLDDGEPGLNEAVLDLEEVPVEELVREAETSSFFGGRRVVIGKNAWFLTAARGKGKVEHRTEELLRYAEQPLESTVLILIAPVEKLDARKKVVKELKKSACTVRFDPLESQELIAWTTKRLKQTGAAVEKGAVERLVRLAGNDLRLIDHECRKLATYVGPGGTVTPEVVSRLVPRTLEQDVFKLVNSVSRQRIDEALSIFYDLLRNREEPIRILALIIRQFRMMLQVKVLAEQGKKEREIAAILQSHPYPVKLALQQGRAFSEATLRQLLQRAIETDQEIKSGRIEKTLGVERLLLNMGAPSRHRA